MIGLSFPIPVDAYVPAFTIDFKSSSSCDTSVIDMLLLLNQTKDITFYTSYRKEAQHEKGKF